MFPSIFRSRWMPGLVIAGVLAIAVAAGLTVYLEYWSAGSPKVTSVAPAAKAVKGGAHSAAWIQDFQAAKEKAGREKKDILLSFEGSDWCLWCQRMEREILDVPEFVNRAGDKFVLVKVDFPRDEPARARVQDAAANERLQKQFGVSGYPAIVVTDAEGHGYGGINGFVEGGVAPFLADLDKLQEVRVERDRLLAAVERQEGAAKLPAAKEALQFLMQRRLHESLKQRLSEWSELARRWDPANAKGYVELFFEPDWYFRFESAPSAGLPRLLKELEAWKAKYGEFKDKERAAFLWMELARGKRELEDYEGAFMCIDEGLKLNPRGPRTRQNLQVGPLALGLGTGTAFAVSDNGHFLTNFHVVGGPGKIFLVLAGEKKLRAAQLVVEDAQLDLALVKIASSKTPMVPLPIAQGHEPRRGEEVGVWGYPLGTTFGHGLKLTKGGISALPEPANRNMLLLDVKVNPGNSGSPLCDTHGNVIGIVSARSRGLPPGGAPLESYGMAVGAGDVARFLQTAGIAVRAGSTEAQPLRWEEIDRRVSASVAMVIKARPMAKNQPAPGE